jgi:branched-chain amino acid transport system permease protein
LFDILQQLINGILTGSIYALIGLGFTMIWGVMHKFNLAYGATALMGAFGSLLVTRWIFDGPMEGPLSIVVAFLAALAAAAIFATVVELLSFRFLPVDYELAPMISSLGMLFIAEQYYAVWSRGLPESFRIPALQGATFTTDQLYFRGDLVTVFVVALLITAILYLVVYRTKLGMATRAVSQQPRAAQLCGISMGRVNLTTFMITALVAGAAGFLTGAAVGAIDVRLATQLTVKGLIAAVIGGLGSFRGAIAAGLLLGIIEYQALWFLGVTYRDMLAYAVLFLILIFKPHGLFGQRPI